MKNTNLDFARHLSRFLGSYLPTQQNCSPHTILSYQDTFRLFLLFMKEQNRLSADKISMTVLNKSIVIDFLNWLRNNRNCSESTVFQRLAVIHSFFKYLQQEAPEHVFLSQSILNIAFKRKPKIAKMNYLPFDGVKNILAQPNQQTHMGRRDLVMLALLYDSSARVQELINIKVRDLRLEYPALINLYGKGSKWRSVPLMGETVKLLKEYLCENELTTPQTNDKTLFTNRSGQKLTRVGVTYILKKYVQAAREKDPTNIIDSVSPHTLRHSKAMHLLQANVDLIYIRDILGHTDIKTTEIYARADSEAKRSVLEKAYISATPKTQQHWNDDPLLMKILKGEL